MSRSAEARVYLNKLGSRLCYSKKRMVQLLEYYKSVMSFPYYDNTYVLFYEPFTPGEYKAFLLGISELGRVSVFSLEKYLPYRSPHEIEVFAKQYFRSLDYKLIEIMHHASYVDSVFKLERARPRFYFNISMLAISEPASLLKGELVQKCNCFTTKLSLAQLPVKDYVTRTIGKYHGLAQRILEFAMSDCGYYAIRTIVFIGLVFKQFCDEQVYLVNTFAKVVGIDPDYCCAIAFGVMCISSI